MSKSKRESAEEAEDAEGWAVARQPSGNRCCMRVPFLSRGKRTDIHRRGAETLRKPTSTSKSKPESAEGAESAEGWAVAKEHSGQSLLRAVAVPGLRAYLADFARQVD